MASMDPSEDEISQVVDFAGLNPVDDRTMIINALKNNNRNVETVVMQYFDNSETFRQKYTLAWNESMFSADRDGANSSNAGISFHIESLDGNDIIQGVTPPPPGYSVGAPSRPPSRSNTRSPLGRMIEWTAGDTAGGTTIHSQEEDDMQRALRESAQEAGIPLPPQESGVMNHSTSTPYFGPANRSDYDQGDWAMVPVGPLKAKLATAPSPSQRKRTPEAPAFIVQGASSVGNHSLGGLLTIFHEIPLARNILLQCGSPAASYGFNSEWWNGQEILPPDVLRQLRAEGPTWGDNDGGGVPRPNFEEEIHRLMAFLDSTERSYGTVNTLTDMIPDAGSGVEKQFYERLGQVNGDVLERLYQEATLASVGGDDVGGVGYENARFGLLEMDHMRTEYAHMKTLYEAIDHLMWGDVLSWQEANERSKMAMFGTMGDVLAIRIGNEGPPESLDIPEHFYPERYLTSRKKEARRILSAWCQTKNALARVATEEQRLQEWQNDWNQLTFNKRHMIYKARDQWQAFSDYLETAGRFQAMEASGFDTNTYPDYRDAPCQMTEGQAKQSEQVDEIQAKQRFLGRLLTNPDKEGRPTPMTCKKYMLRGVASDRDIVYVCQRLRAEPAEPGDSKAPVDQWWRLEYCPNEDQPVRSEKVEIERVLRDIWHDTKTPLLVYATEEAVSTPIAPLSDALRMFVKSDNKAFRQELKQPAADGGEERVRASVEPVSSSKRKHRDSVDSMDSNRASIGSEDRNPFESAFDDQAEEAETELTDMSGSKSEYAKGSDAESKFGDRGIPPHVPSLGAAHMNIESATLTPDTPATDDGDAARPTPPEAGKVDCANEVAKANVAKSPEMQERARPPSFIRPLQGNQGGRDVSMDMEMPDLQE
ncbi:ubiquitin interaction domain-containing [Trichoderma cornu-damae]|uniref:Ubiquitin interaction domain-containing n=1 Tax=Trichoderma cornu-damae TaxID=654480 RepID=A0A9P8U047_9HYPO|nr:ubiquitin interaction domain-containing [Trichoderma cornu-damae]